MDIERLTTKYTGHRVDEDALIAGHRASGLAAALAHAVEGLAHADTELTRLASSLGTRAGTVTEAIAAAPGEPAPTLNPLGELQADGPRFDALIAVRADRITHLRTLVRLWQQLPHDDATS